MKLSNIVELSQQDHPPIRQTPLWPHALDAADRIRASEGRVLAVACAQSVSVAVAVAGTACLTEPAPPDPLESIFVSLEGGAP
jgi:hypothetical protein